MSDNGNGRKIQLSGQLTVGNILNFAVIAVAIVTFLVRSDERGAALDKGLARFETALESFKKDMREDLRDIRRELAGKADKP